METKETDGPVIPLLIYDNQGILRKAALTNTKGYNKSLENGLLWAIDGATGRLLPLTDIDATYANALQAAGKNTGARCVALLESKQTIAIARLDVELSSLPALGLSSEKVSGVSDSHIGLLKTALATTGDSDAMPRRLTVTISTDKAALAAFLFELQETIASRKATMPEGSYTTHLFKAGAGKIRKKTGEEAIELILAQTSAEIASEASDLLYHMMVLFAETGVALEDVLAELKRR